MKAYSAGLMSQSFWFIEFKKVVKLVSDGKSQNDIKAACVEENLLGAVNPYRAKRVAGYLTNRVSTLDAIINYQDLNGIGITKHLALPTVIAICSVALARPVVTGLAVLGDISISGTILKVEDLANVLQVCLDSGAKKVLLPITSAADIGSVPSELVGAFSLIFYSTPQEAVFKALGVD